MVTTSEELELPEPLIQLVQYFLTSKEAARTTLLSKSWHGAWLTRPNLDFDDRDVPRWWYATYPFLELSEKTLKRYEDSNLKVESFRMCKDMHRRSDAPDAHTKTLIARALKFNPPQLSLNFMNYDIVLPNSVFESENLVALTLKGCKIDLGPNPEQLIRCSRLRSLCLDYVKITSVDMFFRMISSFPLIEKLSLSDISFFDDDTVTVGRYFGDHNVVSGIHSLRSLKLSDVYFDTLFLGDFSSKLFRSLGLKDLTLVIRNCPEDGMLISSPSLQHLDLTLENIGRRRSEMAHKMFVFDVPSIRKFTLECTYIPSFSFVSTSTEWEPRVSIRHYGCPTTSWFRDLATLITELSSSRVYLSLYFCCGFSFDYDAEDIQDLPVHEIENLTIDMEGIPTLSCRAILDALFRLCHPKLITQYLSLDDDDDDDDDDDNDDDRSTFGLVKSNNIDFLGQTLLKGLSTRVLTPCQFNYGLNDLKEVRAQIFDEAVSTWWDVPLDALSNDSTTPRANRKVRFHLNWQPKHSPRVTSTRHAELLALTE